MADQVTDPSQDPSTVDTTSSTTTQATDPSVDTTTSSSTTNAPVDTTSDTTTQAPVQSSPVYDPQAKYNWKQTDVFYVSGNEFGILINALRAVLSTKEAQTILLAERANEVVETTLARAVEAGIAVKMTDETQKKHKH